MATILERDSGSFQVKVRRKGLPTLSKTFLQRAEAERWGDEQEGRLTVGVPTNAHLVTTISFREALEWYRDNVTSKKKNSGSEGWRITKLLRGPMAPRPLNTIKPEDLED